MRIRLSISPCPNDTFLFEGLVGQVLSSGGRVDFLDIAELNALAASEDPPDVVKVSCASAPGFLSRYRLLRCGGAFAEAVGPLVLRKSPPRGDGVLLPGRRTTAHILYRKWIRSTGRVLPAESFGRFDGIPAAVAEGRFLEGVVIHESRFTYRDLDLEEIEDLGRFWDRETGTPVPLGCVLVRADRGPGFAREVAQALVEWGRAAFERPDPVTPFVSAHAAEMDPEVQRLHIRTYATRRSLDCGDDGLRALDLLWETAESILPWDLDRAGRLRALDEAVGWE